MEDLVCVDSVLGSWKGRLWEVVECRIGSPREGDTSFAFALEDRYLYIRPNSSLLISA